MKRNYLQALALLVGAGWAAVPAQADDYAYLTLQYGGMQESVVLTAVKKITFGSGTMQLVTDAGTSSYALGTMEKLFFSAVPTAVKAAPEASEGTLDYDARAARLTVGAGAAARRLAVYSLNGTRVKEQAVPAGGAEVSVADLARGLYVVKMGGQTLKIVR